MSTAITVDSSQFNQLAAAVAAAGKSLPKELAAAVNATVKQAETKMSRDIGSEITMKIGDIKKNIKTPRKATAANPQGIVSLSWSTREGLENFKARHTKQGVTYKISRKSGRGFVAGAFMGPKPGMLAPKLYGGVYKRVGAQRKLTKGRRQGKQGQLIVRLFGVSPAGVLVKNDYDDALPGFIQKQLTSQIDRRITLNVLRANGLVPI